MSIPMLVWETPPDDTVAWTTNLPAIIDWLRAHGIEPSMIARRVVVLMDGDARTIHATEYLTDEAGHRYVGDHALGLAATRPLVVPLLVEPPVLAEQ